MTPIRLAIDDEPHLIFAGLEVAAARELALRPEPSDMVGALQAAAIARELGREGNGLALLRGEFQNAAALRSTPCQMQKGAFLAGVGGLNDDADRFAVGEAGSHHVQADAGAADGLRPADRPIEGIGGSRRFGTLAS